jgi:cytochrome P450
MALAFRHDNLDHSRLRRLVEQAFSRHSVENLRGRFGVRCDGLLAGRAGLDTVGLPRAVRRGRLRLTRQPGRMILRKTGQVLAECPAPHLPSPCA